MRIARAGNHWPDSKELPSEADMTAVAAAGYGRATAIHPATRVRSAPMSTNDTEFKSIRLLLVEDDPADARVVERHLKDAGLNHITCDLVQTASDAAQRLQTVEYDLVLLDLGLPDATGLQALRAVRAVADLTPIIVLTGSDDYKQGLVAVREGAQDYLEKRRVNAGMLSRVVSYSVERNMFHRDLVSATRRYQDLFNNVPVALFTANHDGVAQDRQCRLREAAGLPGHPARQASTSSTCCSSPASAPTSSTSCRASAWSRAGRPTSRIAAATSCT